ncbi:glycogen debranching protein GlgX [Viridibacterium curvum]|uniref:Glycogen debranching protein GlgX n=1 Tax=Viridibacterium curvum TaxID=1101404 RepID=A0ABP9QJA3_9RHOO
MNTRSATLLPGRPWPLGSTPDGGGVNFAVYSANATRIELCLFDTTGTQEVSRLPLIGRTDDIFHGYLPEAVPGTVYGFRAYGPWAPQDGHYFNPHKVLLDPYARDIVGKFEWRDEQFACDKGQGNRQDLQPSTLNNAAVALKARVTPCDDFDWAGDEHPYTPLADTVIYEVHVKGFSQRNPAIPEALRGSYAGLAHKASVAHLKRLGVTALSVLPVHYHVDEQRLVQMGLVNYWGYNSINFFSPDPRYASGCDGMSVRDEFRYMVRQLHAAGIEVLLDVVYNHTGEGDASGPCISFRGLDNASYYRLGSENKRHFINDTGCGNTMDIRQPAMLRLVLDSLRYWVEAMHVDGFRFDLAPILGRTDTGFDNRSAFFTAIAQDPVLSRVKMIAEPWDVGPGGYQVGNFPRGWCEWNDHFRDAIRGYWLREQGTRGDLAMRLCGSSDLFQSRRREPVSSINYVISHDGFTLRDLVSYNDRHNEANGEHNRDGHGHNLSNNCGIEGPTQDPAILRLRGRLQRALLATTLFSQGVPMLAAGDELGHSQQGNNNPYCQDNAITWIDWSRADEDLIAFTTRVLELRRQALLFDSEWYSGLTDPLGLHDLIWLNSNGDIVHGQAWRDGSERVLGCLIGKPGRAGAPLLLLINGSHEDRPFMLPAGVWQAWLDSSHPRGEVSWYEQGEVPFPLAAHSVVLLAAAGAQIKLFAQ